MKCKSCGNTVNDESKFCEYCGTKIVVKPIERSESVNKDSLFELLEVAVEVKNGAEVLSLTKQLQQIDASNKILYIYKAYGLVFSCDYIFDLSISELYIYLSKHIDFKVKENVDLVLSLLEEVEQQALNTVVKSIKEFEEKQKEKKFLKHMESYSKFVTSIVKTKKTGIAPIKVDLKNIVKKLHKSVSEMLLESLRRTKNEYVISIKEHSKDSRELDRLSIEYKRSSLAYLNAFDLSLKPDKPHHIYKADLYKMLRELINAILYNKPPKEIWSYSKISASDYPLNEVTNGYVTFTYPEYDSLTKLDEKAYNIIIYSEDNENDGIFEDFTLLDKYKCHMFKINNKDQFQRYENIIEYLKELKEIAVQENNHYYHILIRMIQRDEYRVFGDRTCTQDHYSSVQVEWLDYIEEKVNLLQCKDFKEPLPQNKKLHKQFLKNEKSIKRQVKRNETMQRLKQNGVLLTDFFYTKHTISLEKKYGLSKLLEEL